MPTEPRFILIDTHTKRSVELTTDEVQAAMWRDYLRQPADGSYISQQDTPQRRTESIPSVIKDEAHPWTRERVSLPGLGKSRGT